MTEQESHQLAEHRYDRFATRLRSRFDRAWFLWKYEWMIVVSVIALVLGALTTRWLDPPTPSQVVVYSASAIAVFLLVAELREAWKRWSSWHILARSVPEIRKIAGAAKVPYLGKKVVTEYGVVAVDNDLDAIIDAAAIPIKWEARHYQLPERLKRIAPYVLSSATGGQFPYNGPNVHLDTDVSRESAVMGVPAVLCRGRFFTTLCSNELVGREILEMDLDQRITETYLLDEAKDIYSLDESDLANQIGVSTLAITEDDRLIVVLQSRRTQTSGALWAPSGSGALEPKDLGKRKKRATTLQELVLAGVIRELREETLVAKESIGGSALIGYGRWIDRGASPEFYCVTALKIHSSDVVLGTRVHPIWSPERLWTSDVQLERLNLTKLKIRENSGPIWPKSGLVPHRTWIRPESASVPLSMALDALCRALKKNPSLIDQLRDRS